MESHGGSQSVFRAVWNSLPGVSLDALDSALLEDLVVK